MRSAALGIRIAIACSSACQAQGAVFGFFAALLALGGFFGGLFFFFLSRGFGGFFFFQALLSLELVFFELGGLFFVGLQLFGFGLAFFLLLGLVFFQLQSGLGLGIGEFLLFLGFLQRFFLFQCDVGLFWRLGRRGCWWRGHRLGQGFGFWRRCGGGRGFDHRFDRQGFRRRGRGLGGQGGPKLGGKGHGFGRALAPLHCKRQGKHQRGVRHQRHQHGPTQPRRGRRHEGLAGRSQSHGACQSASCTDRPTRSIPARCSVSITLTTLS